MCEELAKRAAKKVKNPSQLLDDMNNNVFHNLQELGKVEMEKLQSELKRFTELEFQSNEDLSYAIIKYYSFLSKCFTLICKVEKHCDKFIACVNKHLQEFENKINTIL